MPSLIRRNKLAYRVFDVWCNAVAAHPVWPVAVRRYLYRLAGIRLTDQAILPGCVFTGNLIEIGAGSWINRRVFLDCMDAPIRIGRNCGIAMDVLLVTDSHTIGGPHKRGDASLNRPIVIEDGVWIGARATVLPGVTIARGCVIAAGAVVSRSCEPDGLYVGVPARRLRHLAADEPRTDPAP